MTQEKRHVIVAGGGAAGMAAAIAAARSGCRVSLYEKNEKLGKKLFITGKGRCNITNACDTEDLFRAVVSNAKLLYSSFYGFTNQDMMALLEDAGLRLKTERGNRVFPASDKSSDVISTLERILKKEGVSIHLNSRVEGLWVEEGICRGILLEGRGTERYHGAGAESGTMDSGQSRYAGCRREAADSVIVATGGLSYPSTGSTGDGYRWAEELGHKITDLSPALVPFEAAEALEVKALQGLSLKNVEAAVYAGGKELYREFGEMLFTHFGVSGPILLSASSYGAKAIKKQPLRLVIDLKPALTAEQLDERILRDFGEAVNKQFKNALNHLYPAKMIPVIIARSGIHPDKKVNEITKEERRRLAEVTKGLEFTLTALRSFKEAIITQGGISVKQINPSTMESKQTAGLYFAGEVLDLDAVTGGYNLQIAWSTGWCAGTGTASRE